MKRRTLPNHSFCAGTLKSRIYHFLKNRPFRQFTMWEVAKCIGAKPCSVSARMHELFLSDEISINCTRHVKGAAGAYFTLWAPPSEKRTRTKRGGVLYYFHPGAEEIRIKQINEARDRQRANEAVFHHAQNNN